jgi:hypothetical protein
MNQAAKDDRKRGGWSTLSVVELVELVEMPCTATMQRNTVPHSLTGYLTMRCHGLMFCDAVRGAD